MPKLLVQLGYFDYLCTFSTRNICGFEKGLIPRYCGFGCFCYNLAFKNIERVDMIELMRLFLSIFEEV